MQLGSRPLFPFLFLSLIAACGSDGSGGSGGSGGSSTQTGGSGSGARGGSSAGGSGGSSSTGTGGSSSTGTGGSSSTGTGGSPAGTGGSGAGTGGGGAGGSGGSGGSPAGGSGGSQSGTGGSGMAPDGGPAAEAGGMPGKLGAPVEFTIPRANNYPHDPAVDSKGRGWWVDSDNSYVGYWDPATGMTKDFPSARPGCYLHGLNPDDQDNIWYTGKGCNKIGKLEPGDRHGHRVPGDGGPPHAGVPQGRHLVHGPERRSRTAAWIRPRACRRSGRPALAAAPTASGPRPTVRYGWPCSAAAQRPQDRPDQPGEPGHAARAAGPQRRQPAAASPSTSKGHVYYTDYPRGYLGRFDPAANKFEEFLSPKGPGSRPYGITVGSRRSHLLLPGHELDRRVQPAAPDGMLRWCASRPEASTVRNMATDFVRRRVWLGLNGRIRARSPTSRSRRAAVTGGAERADPLRRPAPVPPRRPPAMPTSGMRPAPSQPHAQHDHREVGVARAAGCAPARRSLESPSSGAGRSSWWRPAAWRSADPRSRSCPPRAGGSRSSWRAGRRAPGSRRGGGVGGAGQGGQPIRGGRQRPSNRPIRSHAPQLVQPALRIGDVAVQLANLQAQRAARRPVWHCLHSARLGKW